MARTRWPSAALAIGVHCNVIYCVSFFLIDVMIKKLFRRA